MQRRKLLGNDPDSYVEGKLWLVALAGEEPRWPAASRPPAPLSEICTPLIYSTCDAHGNVSCFLASQLVAIGLPI